MKSWFHKRMNNEEDNEPTSDEDVDSDADACEALPPEDSIHEQEDPEPWVEWIKRTTHTVEGHMQKLHIECWTRQVRRRQWKWAQRVAEFSDNRWAKIAANWNPQLHFDGRQSKAMRRQSRPKQRWEHHFNAFLKNKYGYECVWSDLAKDAKRWAELEDLFVNGS